MGLSIQTKDNPHFHFAPETVKAIAHIPANGRLLIGNAKGELHLWDAESAKSVSLIGRHSSAINSIAFHPKGRLVSGDVDGNLIAWDLQSGQVLGTASVSRAISSVRWSLSGDHLVVVAGGWTATDESTSLSVFSGRSLQHEQTIDLPFKIAIAQQDEQLGWLSIDWSGIVRSLNTNALIGNIEKANVSGIVLCQDLFELPNFTQERPNE